MLAAYDPTTGKRVNKGDRVVSFRGEAGTFNGATRAPESGRTGKVSVDGREYYENVWGLIVREDVGPALQPAGTVE